jgi:type I restriction enzyme, R subunit
MYEPAMRHLIDTYIQSEDSRKVSAFDDLSLIQLIVERGAGAVNELPAGIANQRPAMAETIENNLRKVIIDEQPLNPKYYDRMSDLLDALIQKRKADAIEYEAYLQQIVELTQQIANPSGRRGGYPKSLKTNARRALYDNLGQNEELAVTLDQAIQSVRQDDWRGNIFKERAIRKVIREVLQDDEEIQRIMQLVKNQVEY